MYDRHVHGENDELKRCPKSENTGGSKISVWGKNRMAMLIISAVALGQPHYIFISIPSVSPEPATFDYNQLGLRQL